MSSEAGEIAIVGAGRQGRNVRETLERYGAGPIAGFLDDTMSPGAIIDGAPILGGFDRLSDVGFVKSHRWNVAIGDCGQRWQIAVGLDALEADFVAAVHPRAEVSINATIGRGVYLAAFTRVAPGAALGDWVIVESGSVIGVDCSVAAGCLLGPSTSVLAAAILGRRTQLGAGAVVLQERCVGDDCVIGANAVVTRDLAAGSRAFGVPARRSDLEGAG